MCLITSNTLSFPSPNNAKLFYAVAIKLAEGEDGRILLLVLVLTLLNPFSNEP